MAENIVPFPVPPSRGSSTAPIALAAIGFQWRPGMRRWGVLSDADIDALDQAAPSRTGIKRCSFRLVCTVLWVSTISIDQRERTWGRRPGWPLRQGRRQTHQAPQGKCGMRVESVDTPSLVELRAIVAQRLHACGARMVHRSSAVHHPGPTLHGHRSSHRWEEGRTIYLTHLCPPVDRTRSQTVLDMMARLCPEVIAAVRE
jgi:hypothetical protein